MALSVRHQHLDEMKPWSDRQHLLECLSAIPEAPDVMTFTFRSDKDNWFRYLPGQFVTLELPVGPEQSVMRTYTLSSTPSRPFSVAVTVKAQASSIGTRWMFENLKPGMRIRAFGPLGDFTHIKHPGQKYLFISAGSGITPMMAMTRYMSDTAPLSDITFLNCSRSPSDIIFRSELEYLARFMPNLHLGFVVEGAGNDLWSGLKGRIDKAKIALLSPDFMERTIFCCGPEVFMDSVRSMLVAHGFDMSRFHQESFQPAQAPTPLAEVSDDTSREASTTVRFTMAGKDVSCAPGQTILQAARGAGVRIGAACESGLCGTCRVMKLSGDVEMSHNGGILDEEIDEGYILACCSRPRTDVEVEA